MLTVGRLALRFSCQNLCSLLAQCLLVRKLAGGIQCVVPMSPSKLGCLVGWLAGWLAGWVNALHTPTHGWTVATMGAVHLISRPDKQGYVSPGTRYRPVMRNLVREARVIWVKDRDHETEAYLQGRKWIRGRGIKGRMVAILSGQKGAIQRHLCAELSGKNGIQPSPWGFGRGIARLETTRLAPAWRPPSEPR